MIITIGKWKEGEKKKAITIIYLTSLFTSSFCTALCAVMLPFWSGQHYDELGS